MSKPLIAISGASSGIGKATAHLFSQAGHPLLLMARRLELLEELNLPNTLCRFVDVSNTFEFKNAVQAAEEQFGSVDCLINNAGVMLLGNMDTQSPDEWKQMLDTNVMGVLNGIHAVLPGMIQRKQGTIINISSIAGKKAAPVYTVYCGTKFAVHGITEGLRQEVAEHNVRVIAIAPGFVETELFNHTTSEDFKANSSEWRKQMGGGLDPEVIAKAILFAYKQPQTVCMREVTVAPTRQEL